LGAAFSQTPQEINANEILRELIETLRKKQDELLKYMQTHETLGESEVNEILNLHGRIDTTISKYNEMKTEIKMEQPAYTQPTHTRPVQTTPVQLTQPPVQVNNDDDIFASFVGERVAKLSINAPTTSSTPKPVYSNNALPTPSMSPTTTNYPSLPTLPPQIYSTSIPHATVNYPPLPMPPQNNLQPIPVLTPLAPVNVTSLPKSSTTTNTTNNTNKPVWLEFDPLANK